MGKYFVTIGLEMHCEGSLTNSKVFSPAKNEYNKLPNCNVSPIDMGFPGVLPVANKKAVEQAIMIASVLHARIPEYMYWERKNYYYPDLPKGYQITQNPPEECVGNGGYVDVEREDGSVFRVTIDNLHLEEDAAQLTHLYDTSTINYNRAGNPLFELVTDPVIHSADDAVAFLETMRAIYQDKKNNDKKIIVTVGGTKEAIDNVRYITNASSGKMGFSLCDWAYRLGYNVKAISTIEAKKPYEITLVKSADEMLSELEKEDFDYLIMASAVADFKVKEVSANKISKENIKNGFSLELIKNPDIAYEIAKNKRENQKVVGFCLGDNDLIQNAKMKLKNKNLDYIVANEINVALNTDKNKVTIIDKNDKITNIDTDTKENIAKKILEVVCD